MGSHAPPSLSSLRLPFEREPHVTDDHDESRHMLRRPSRQYGNVGVHDHGTVHQGDIFNSRSYNTIYLNLPCNDRPSLALQLQDAARLLQHYEALQLTSTLSSLSIPHYAPRPEQSDVEKNEQRLQRDPRGCEKVVARGEISHNAEGVHNSEDVSLQPKRSQVTNVAKGTLSVESQMMDQTAARIFTLLGFALFVGLMKSSISHLEIQQMLVTMQILLNYVQDRKISALLFSMFLMAGGLVLQRTSQLNSLTRPHSEIFLFEDAFSVLSEIPRAYLKSPEIFEGWLFTHYRNSNAMDFIRSQSYSITIGSRNGPLLDLRSLAKQPWKNGLLRLVMAVTCIEVSAECPDCSAAVKTSADGSLICNLCRREFYTRAELWKERPRMTYTTDSLLQSNDHVHNEDGWAVHPGYRDICHSRPTKRFAGLRNIDFHIRQPIPALSSRSTSDSTMFGDRKTEEAARAEATAKALTKQPKPPAAIDEDVLERLIGEIEDEVKRKIGEMEQEQAEQEAEEARREAEYQRKKAIERRVRAKAAEFGTAQHEAILKEVAREREQAQGVRPNDNKGMAFESLKARGINTSVEDRLSQTPSATMKCLASARLLDDPSKVRYPDGFTSPNPALTFKAPPGTFRYNNEFLLQFQYVFPRTKLDKLASW